MIDTHSHLLPWVDHGCPDLQTSVLMAQAAAASGVDMVVCTPHLSDMDETVIEGAREAVDEVRAALETAEVDLKLLLGFEVDLAVATSYEPAALAELTIEGSEGAIVLETPFHGWPPFMEETVFRLSAAGLRPVLAHPERNNRVQEAPELLTGCLKAGAVAQATVASTLGEFGRKAEKAFFRLLSEGWIGLLATDAHAYRADGWTLTSVLKDLGGTLTEEDVSKLVEENPRRLLRGEGIGPLAPVKGGASVAGKARRQSYRGRRETP